VPGVSQTVVLTRLAQRTTKSLGPGDDLAAYAAQGGLLALFLSAGDPERLRDVLLGPGSAYTPATPAAIVHRVSWPDEQVIPTTVGEIATVLTERAITTTALVLVGEALAPRSPSCVERSHVYDPTFATAFRSAEA